MGTRRLAAIIVADVVGYSAMMADDAEATLATLKAHRTTTRLGRPDEARPHLEAILRVRPGFTATGLRSALTWRRPEDAEHVIEGLVAAGLPR